MIIFDLKCSDGHTFEGWFKGREELDGERSSGRLSCPVCGGQEIAVLPTGGHLTRSSRTDRTDEEQRHPPRQSGVKSFLDFLEKNFDNVGPRFAEEAAKIHFGEIDPKNIHGTMTPEEEQDLQEEGVDYMKVPIPKFQS